MRRASTTAILLTLFMLLMVLSAAVVFLAMGNRNLQQEVEVGEQDQASQAATRDSLASELLVREAAIDAITATREALASQVALEEQQVEGLEAQVDKQAESLADVESQLEQLEAQVFIFSPKDGAIVTPAESLDILVAARAAEGVDGIEVSINDEDTEFHSAEGQNAFAVRIPWTPPAEGEYTIQAEARTRDGESSEPQTVKIQAAYASQSEREAAIQRRIEEDITTIRFSEPIEPQPERTLESQNSFNLHRVLLPGGEFLADGDVVNNKLVLRVFDFLSESDELNEFYNAIDEQQPLGIYNPVDNLTRFVATASEGASESLAPIVHVHSFLHQWQQDRFQVETAELADLDLDARMAAGALLEGDINFVQDLYLNGDFLSQKEKTELEQALIAAETPVIESVPEILSNSFIFAYQAGHAFVESLHELNGFSGVDIAWNKFPQSTEQILHPDQFLLNDAPKEVNLLPVSDAIGPGWRLIDENSFGEFYLRQYLQQQLEVDQVDEAAAGWGGGSYVVYQNELDRDLLMMLRLAWDEPLDNAEFAAAYADYLRSMLGAEPQRQSDEGLCWQDGEVFCLYLFDNESLVVRAPDLEIASTVAEIQQNAPAAQLQ
jgi:hypothetical protein